MICKSKYKNLRNFFKILLFYYKTNPYQTKEKQIISDFFTIHINLCMKQILHIVNLYEISYFYVHNCLKR